MEVYNHPADIFVFGFVVNDFPAGIGDAFDILIQKTGDCAGARNYYGLSEYKDGKMVYYALAEEKSSGEAAKYDYEKYILDNGDYVSITVSEWHKEINSIKDAFSKIIKGPRVNKTKPAIEWYKSADEMLCLVHMNE